MFFFNAAWSEGESDILNCTFVLIRLKLPIIQMNLAMVTNKIEANILIRFAHTTMTIRQELRISKMAD